MDYSTTYPTTYGEYCGDNICQSSESTYNSCPIDCDTTTQTTCPSNSFGDGNYICNYSTCPNGCDFDSSGCATSCITITDVCGDNVCGLFEDPYTCSVYCGVPCMTTSDFGTCDYGYDYDANGCVTSCTAYTPPPETSSTTSCGDPLTLFGECLNGYQFDSTTGCATGCTP